MVHSLRMIKQRRKNGKKEVIKKKIKPKADTDDDIDDNHNNKNLKRSSNPQTNNLSLVTIQPEFDGNNNKIATPMVSNLILNANNLKTHLNILSFNDLNLNESGTNESDMDIDKFLAIEDVARNNNYGNINNNNNKRSSWKKLQDKRFMRQYEEEKSMSHNDWGAIPEDTEEDDKTLQNETYDGFLQALGAEIQRQQRREDENLQFIKHNKRMNKKLNKKSSSITNTTTNTFKIYEDVIQEQFGDYDDSKSMTFNIRINDVDVKRTRNDSFSQNSFSHKSQPLMHTNNYSSGNNNNNNNNNMPPSGYLNVFDLPATPPLSSCGGIMSDGSEQVLNDMMDDNISVNSDTIRQNKLMSIHLMKTTDDDLNGDNHFKFGKNMNTNMNMMRMKHIINNGNNNYFNGHTGNTPKKKKNSLKKKGKKKKRSSKKSKKHHKGKQNAKNRHFINGIMSDREDEPKSDINEQQDTKMDNNDTENNQNTLKIGNVYFNKFLRMTLLINLNINSWSRTWLINGIARSLRTQDIRFSIHKDMAIASKYSYISLLCRCDEYDIKQLKNTFEMTFISHELEKCIRESLGKPKLKIICASCVSYKHFQCLYSKQFLNWIMHSLPDAQDIDIIDDDRNNNNHANKYSQIEENKKLEIYNHPNNMLNRLEQKDDDNGYNKRKIYQYQGMNKMNIINADYIQLPFAQKDISSRDAMNFEKKQLFDDTFGVNLNNNSYNNDNDSLLTPPNMSVLHFMSVLL